MKNIINLILFKIQKILLLISFWIFSLFITRKKEIWVVGVDEISGLLLHIGNMLNPAVTICLNNNKFYSNDYSYSFSSLRNTIKSTFIIKLVRIFLGPIIFGYLTSKYNNFFYLGDNGFLDRYNDGRWFEFSFLKSKSKTLVCFFSGNDIRSPSLALEQSRAMDLEVTATYYWLVAPHRLSEEYENKKRRIAKSADAFANKIFNAPVDQISYLTREVHPFFYVCPDNGFAFNELKFEHLNKFKIVHAPSSPIVKGTQLVRASIKKLKTEGYNIEYVELIGSSNENVLLELRDAHIVLNEFYSFVPGVFGVEAMASHCALLTSGDPNIELALGSDADNAWMVTQYWMIYDNLKFLLDNTVEIKKYADAGFLWAQKNCSYTAVKTKIKFDLNN